MSCVIFCLAKALKCNRAGSDLYDVVCLSGPSQPGPDAGHSRAKGGLSKMGRVHDTVAGILRYTSGRNRGNRNSLDGLCTWLAC